MSRSLTLVKPPDTRHLERRSELIGLVVAGGALFFGLALWSYERADMLAVLAGRTGEGALANLTGAVGVRSADILLGLFGVGAWALDGLLWVVAYRTLVGRDVTPRLRAVAGGLGLTLGGLAIIHLVARALELRPYGKDAAGFVGSAVAELLRAFLSTAGAAIVAGVVLTASISTLSGRPLFRMLARQLAALVGRASSRTAAATRARGADAWSALAASRRAAAERRAAARQAQEQASAEAVADGDGDDWPAVVDDGVFASPPAPPTTPPSAAAVIAGAPASADAKALAPWPFDQPPAPPLPAGRVAMPDTRPSAPMRQLGAAAVAPIKPSEPALDADGFPIGAVLAPPPDLVPSAHRLVRTGVCEPLVHGHNDGGRDDGDYGDDDGFGAVIAIDYDKVVDAPPSAAARGAGADRRRGHDAVDAHDLDDDDGVIIDLPLPTAELAAVPPPIPADSDDDGDDDSDALPTAMLDAVAAPTGSEGATSLRGALAAARAKGPRIVETEAMKQSGPAATPVPGAAQGALDIGDKKTWRTPPSFLVQPPPERVVAAAYDILVDNARILEQKLADFKITGEVTDIRPGPVVTTYEYRPAAGVKISRIANLKDDLTMSLAALRVRVVAPIPGRDVVGIEVPNKSRQIVYFRELLESKHYAEASSKLTLILGKDIEGKPVTTDLAKAPHLLVAGATGTGKSVGINSFLASMLFKATPEDVKLILIDPKVLELSVYEGIPHLLLPVIDDPHKAELALKWACREMDRRYHVLADAKVRNIAGYKTKLPELRERARRSKVTVSNGRKVLVDVNSPGAELLEAAPEPEDMPYIVIVIDEFADLIMASGKEVERAVARLAQKARAAGLHVILATQRPSTDVITGMIKANFPTRVSFQVASAIDSKVVLNAVGAESLLGMGDMLFVPPGTSHLRRCHGTWITDEEVVKLAEHWREQGAPDYDMSILADPEGEGPSIEDDADLDELFEDAVRVAVEAEQASVSFLQRKLGIGYGRAARIIDHMEARGIVGPQRGPNKPREILGGLDGL